MIIGRKISFLVKKDDNKNCKGKRLEEKKLGVSRMQDLLLGPANQKRKWKIIWQLKICEHKSPEQL